MTTSVSQIPQLSAVDLFSNNTTQQMPLGSYVETNDGRGYRYSLVGAVSTVPGKLYQSSAQDTTNLNPSGGLSVAAAAIGDTAIVTTSTVTLTANQVANGFLSVNITPGQGYTYRIKSHAAATAAVVTFNLDDPIKVALTTSSKIVVAAHPYSGIILNPATATSTPAGVANSIITNANYGWIQTFGPCAVLVDTAIAIGSSIVPSAAVAGAVKLGVAAVPVVGYAIDAGVNTEYDLMFLTIH